LTSAARPTTRSTNPLSVTPIFGYSNGPQRSANHRIPRPHPAKKKYNPEHELASRNPNRATLTRSSAHGEEGRGLDSLCNSARLQQYFNNPLLLTKGPVLCVAAAGLCQKHKPCVNGITKTNWYPLPRLPIRRSIF